jgi:hypothetical protein
MDRRLPAGLVLCAIASLAGPPALAAELKPQTVAAFDRYVRVNDEASQRSLDDPDRFLWIDTLPDAAARAEADRVRQGGLVIERLKRKDGERNIDIPDGIVHHWLGAVFVPGATARQAVALLQDYDRHAAIYAPNVARSRTLSQSGDQFRIDLRFFMKKVLTVVVNSEHDARFTWHDEQRASSRIVSTRIAEVEDPDTPREREKPVGNDGGYLWRLNSYWRFLQRDGGTYVQCETITLSRGIPFGLGWIVGPFVNSIPRETLAFTLERTRQALLAR